MFDERINQIDLRFTKGFRFGRTRVQGMPDIYNITNANTVTGIVNAYGAVWLRATQVMGGRLFKFGAQLDY